MTVFINNSTDEPFVRFKAKYDLAKENNQDMIEAISISSYDHEKKEVDSRFVNLKFVDNKHFIFFTNYNSPKAKQFSLNNNISALIYWSKINTQIRIKANINKTSNSFNQEYFYNRSKEKNALSISSNQSMPINSYDDVVNNFNKVLEKNNLLECPSYWGGFSFEPYELEIWEGRKYRINNRVLFRLVNDSWQKSFIQP